MVVWYKASLNLSGIRDGIQRDPKCHKKHKFAFRPIRPRFRWRDPDGIRRDPMQNTCVFSAKVIGGSTRLTREHCKEPFLEYLQRFLVIQKSECRKIKGNTLANFTRPQRNGHLFYKPAPAEEDKTLYIRNSMEEDKAVTPEHNSNMLHTSHPLPPQINEKSF